MVEWFLSLDGIYIYFWLFGFLLAGAVGAPIPEDLPLFAAGIAIQLNKVDPIWALAVCYAGVVLGDLFIYAVGRTCGAHIFRLKIFSSSRSRAKIRKINTHMVRHSVIMIFVARHLFYLRTLTFLTCGVVRMPFLRFLISDALAALVSVPLVIGLGFTASEHYQVVLDWINKGKQLSLLVGILILLCALYFYRRRRLHPPAESVEGPGSTN